MEASHEGALVVTPQEQAIQSLLHLEPRLHEVVQLDVEYVDNIDSTNMKPEHWDRMTAIIAEKYDQYDGFVITHGTDTMAYTSSALSFSLQDLGKPVVLTGAQIPGAKIETDGRRNFVNAVSVAMLDFSGVVLVFDEEIILGARASKVSESKLDAFETINWDVFGEIRIDMRLSDERKPRHDRPLNIQGGFEPNVAVMELTPGLPVATLTTLLESGIRGLILLGYGPGNIAYDYLPVLQTALKKQIPVVVSTQCLEGATSMHLYDVGKQALDAGAIQAYDMSLECVTTKLMWALKHFPYEKIREIMHTNYTGEINKEGKIY
ncbi:MAG: hypothetical protein RL141_143 [Candidatus Parcubacteria bacterium]